MHILALVIWRYRSGSELQASCEKVNKDCSLLSLYILQPKQHMCTQNVEQCTRHIIIFSQSARFAVTTSIYSSVVLHQFFLTGQSLVHNESCSGQESHSGEKPVNQQYSISNSPLRVLKSCVSEIPTSFPPVFKMLQMVTLE